MSVSHRSDPFDPVRDAKLRIAACQATRPVRIGVLVNGCARRMVSGRAQARLTRSAGDGVPIVWTSTIAEVPGALRELLCRRGVNVLAVAGGDGTVHHIVNALLDLHAQHVTALQAASGAVAAATVALPRMLILNGGTLNIIGRTVGIHGPPHHTLGKFQRHFAGASLRRVPARRVPLLHVSRPASSEQRYGFVFGSETLFHAIELYVRFGAGYLGLARFLAELSRGATAGSGLWREERWKLGPFGHPISVDGVIHPTYTAVVASTVDLTLAIAAIRAIRRPLGASGFHAKVVLEADPLALVRQIPAMMSERSTPGVVDVPEAHELSLLGPYTLDGECFADPGPGRSPLRVATAAHRIALVPGEFGAAGW